MSAYVGPIRRVETAKGHRYEDANRRRVPGVTTIISQGVPKPALINWAANSTAEYAVDHWAELGELSSSARLKKLQGARYEVKDAAANRGTEIHNRAEKLAQGEEVDLPDDIAGHVESYIHFLDEFQVEVVLLEAVVFSHRHGYAGTTDAVFRFPLGLPGYDMPAPVLLCDLKSNRTGIFGETALQLAGYRYADTYVDANGDEQPMIEVDGCAAIHVRADGFDLIPVTAGPQQHRALLYAAQVGEFVQDSRDLVGNPIPPPSRVQRRRLEIVRDLKESA